MNFKHFDWTDKKVLCVGLNTFDFSLKGDESASPKSKLAEVNLSCLAVVWKSTWKKLIKIFPQSSNLVSVSSIFTDFIIMESSGNEKFIKLHHSLATYLAPNQVNLTSYFQIVISLEKFVKLHHSQAK